MDRREIRSFVCFIVIFFRLAFCLFVDWDSLADDLLIDSLSDSRLEFVESILLLRSVKDWICKFAFMVSLFSFFD